MRESIVGLAEKADLAIAAASGVVDEEWLASIAEVSRYLRLRLDYPEDVLIVALAGGTGSGKSSIFNALAGEERAQVGGVRPTTRAPLAAVAGPHSAAVAGYLASLGIESVETAPVPAWLCLVDLPDTDSVEVDHRLQVDALLPKVDVVVWVTDPEKYRDAALHHGYLSPMAAYASQFVFVLNQMDRIDAESLPAVLSDFEEALVADGIGRPVVVATSAGPPAGPPQGIEELLDAVLSLRGVGVLAKIIIDLDESAGALRERAGESGLDFARRAHEVSRGAAKLVVRDQAEQATDLLTDFLHHLAAEAGGLSEDRIRELATAVPTRVSRAVPTGAPAASGGLFNRIRRRPVPSTTMHEVAKSIDTQVMAPVGRILRQRAAAIAAITDLSLSVAAARADLSV